MAQLTTPPPDVVQRLASERTLSAVKEAGRGVAHIVCGLPLHDISIRYRRSWVGGGWHVESRTRDVRHGSLDLFGLEAVQGLAVAAGAGAEAQARWLVEREGITVAVAREKAFRSDATVREAARYLPHCDWTLDELIGRVQALVAQRWAPITAVTEQLLCCGRLTGDDVRDLVA
ncbi:hypothetical protein [Amycolatopsis sp. NPDC004079]|uniref:hypothetical protein n=1 Tax=Amycolatopsis sp. NPDC004079 TaxID=3154549 RepID=UPI0033BC5856